MPVTIATSSEVPATSSTTKVNQKNCVLIFSKEISSRITPGKGTLFVDEQKLIFHSPDTSTVISVDYPTIVIHAISRGDADPVTRAGCIYCQLGSAAVVDDRSPEARTAQGSADETKEDEDEDDMSDDTCEMRIVPDDADALDDIFLALSECAALHPDPDFVDDEEGDGDWMYSAGEAAELTEAGQAALDHLESVFDVAPGATFTFRAPTGGSANPGQFDDAEETEDNGGVGR
ncbi:regulator of volume decrease after cellular swelling-domain-containing protein [Chytridium lagenaria]|nr:regulator of volume decrease after cellular swelling-domain-containing protein [Chytridium lagenaria]